MNGYDELIKHIEQTDIAGVTNPGFELLLLLHVAGSYGRWIKGQESEYLTMDEKGKYSHAYKVLHEITCMNAKRNAAGNLAGNVMTAILQEKMINQDIHDIKGKVTGNIGSIIEKIMNEKPDM